jgi:hypothetical protein
MKKLLVIKAILLVVALILISLFASCSTDETPITQTEQSKTLDVTIQGNSPEFWYHNAKENTTTKYTQSHIVLEVHKGDTINAIGYGYTIDNTNNYNAPNVVVVGYITFKVNGVVVASGIDTLAHLIK